MKVTSSNALRCTGTKLRTPPTFDRHPAEAFAGVLVAVEIEHF
jgi:hypothetical protein